MALQPPSPQTNVPRNDVGNVVDAMLLDSRVRWISVVFDSVSSDVERFTVTPFIKDPATNR